MSEGPLIFFIAVEAFLCFMFVRNHRVSQYRKRLLDQVHTAASDDIDRGIFDWRWRYDALNKVSYDSMMVQFWRRLDSFYPDLAFTRKTA